MGGEQRVAAGPPERASTAVAPQRASAGAAIGTMTLIAVVAVVVAVAGPRLTSGSTGEQAQAEQAMEHGPPELLAGDIPPDPVPRTVQDAVDVPVVGAAVLSQAPEGVSVDCVEGFAWEEEPEERVVVGPENVTVTFVGKGTFPGEAGPEGGPDLMVATCSASFRDGRWQSEGASLGPVDTGGHSLSVSSDGSGRAWARAVVAVPPEAAWALHRRSGYAVAYDVAGQQTLPVTWTFPQTRMQQEPPPTPVLFVDGDGAPISETFVGQGP